MSLAIVRTRAQVGIDAPAVTVEVHLSGGLPSFAIVGLPETAVKESRERVRSALLNSGFEFPARRITVNLAPADLPKEGGRYDLAIAIGILAATGQLKKDQLDGYEFLAELALSGELRPVSGVLPAALECQRAQNCLWLMADNVAEASLVDDLTIFSAKSLLQVCGHISGAQLITHNSPTEIPVAPPHYPDLQEVKGQHQAKRALEIAAAGSHNLLFSGPPGSGKSMLADRLPGILPQLSSAQLLEVAAIYSVAGMASTDVYAAVRPFRAPHHTASAVALVGGGSRPRPGEVSLAHHGVLFLDELPEYSRQVLEVLREPMESGHIHISRVAQQICFPARFQLVAAMNPCPCGFAGDSGGRCRCTPDQVNRYQSKISGPLLDRIDMQAWVPGLPADQLMAKNCETENSAAVRKRVAAAREVQLHRQGYENSVMGVTDIEKYCCLQQDDQALLITAMQRMNLSARAVHRVLKVARTIADLNGQLAIQRDSLLEAIGFRRSRS
ncbi:MAG: YifB family Mg chelatase-like AAA ATPase [Amphritea sp.]